MALLCCCCAAQDALDCSTGRGERHGKRKRTNCVGAPSTETSSACQAKRRLLFVARSLALPLVRSLSLSLSLARARARILLRGARHEALESAVRHFAVDNERRTHLKTATVESRTGDVIFQILRELSAKICGELALFFRRNRPVGDVGRLLAPNSIHFDFSSALRLQRAGNSPLVYVCC